MKPSSSSDPMRVYTCVFMTAICTYRIRPSPFFVRANVIMQIGSRMCRSLGSKHGLTQQCLSRTPDGQYIRFFERIASTRPENSVTETPRKDKSWTVLVGDPYRKSSPCGNRLKKWFTTICIYDCALKGGRFLDVYNIRYDNSTQLYLGARSGRGHFSAQLLGYINENSCTIVKRIGKWYFCLLTLNFLLWTFTLFNTVVRRWIFQSLNVNIQDIYLDRALVSRIIKKSFSRYHNDTNFLVKKHSIITADKKLDVKKSIVCW